MSCFKPLIGWIALNIPFPRIHYVAPYSKFLPRGFEKPRRNICEVVMSEQRPGPIFGAGAQIIPARSVPVPISSTLLRWVA